MKLSDLFHRCFTPRDFQIKTVQNKILSRTGLCGRNSGVFKHPSSPK